MSGNRKGILAVFLALLCVIGISLTWSRLLIMIDKHYKMDPGAEVWKIHKIY